MTLGDLCAELRNYFVRDILHDEFIITDGSIQPPPDLQDGQYFRIVGSVFNDGVHQYGSAELVNETFTGEIWAMAVPPAVMSILSDINAWVGKNAEALQSPYQSESFGGYSYTKSSGYGSNGSAGPLTWQSQFAPQLNKWRRVSVK